MRCTRCGAGVIQTELYHDLVKIEGISGWRCGHCGLIKYRNVVAARLSQKSVRSHI